MIHSKVPIDATAKLMIPLDFVKFLPIIPLDFVKKLPIIPLDFYKTLIIFAIEKRTEARGIS